MNCAELLDVLERVALVVSLVAAGGLLFVGGVLWGRIGWTRRLGDEKDES